MRYFVPDIQTVAPRTGRVSGLLGKILARDSRTSQPTLPNEKLGGVPYGLSSDKWPTCPRCGKSQSLLAQLRHHSERLNLGREGRLLFVFQCNHDPGVCRTWEAFSGSNICLVVEPEELGNALAEIPADGPAIEDEVSISDWIVRDDGLPESIAPQFDEFETFEKLDQDTRGKVTTLTRLGGVPFWLQGPDDMPRPGWRFAGQLDSAYSFMKPPATINEWISEDRDRFEGRTHVARGPNFGDGGIAYLFLKDIDGVPRACMIWQCL